MAGDVTSAQSITSRNVLQCTDQGRLGSWKDMLNLCKEHCMTEGISLCCLNFDIGSLLCDFSDKTVGKK